MINDEPIAHTKDGRPLFDNTPTVVVMMVLIHNRILVVRRGNEPGRGLLGLPGGYHMRGESWQEAGCREVMEETGYLLDPNRVSLFQQPVTDEYGCNLMIARHHGPVERQPDWQQPDEVMEVLRLNYVNNPEDWAFPRHFKAARRLCPHPEDTAVRPVGKVSSFVS